jgi:hypothetical protein
MIRTGMICAFATVALVLATGAGAVDPVSPCAAGFHPAVIRQSRIKPGGTMAAFLKAEAGQEKWYAAHKLPDRLFVAPMLEGRAATARISDREAMTVHVYRTPPGQAFPAHDAAWDAFVAAFRANSEIVNTARVCLPD